MHAVGAQGARKLDVAGDQRRHLACLHGLDERLDAVRGQGAACRRREQQAGDAGRAERGLHPLVRALIRLDDDVELGHPSGFHLVVPQAVPDPTEAIRRPMGRKSGLQPAQSRTNCATYCAMPKVDELPRDPVCLR